MTLRLKQRMAGVIGVAGAVLLLVAVGGLVARSVNSSSRPGQNPVAEERSHEPQRVSPATTPVSAAAPVVSASQGQPSSAPPGLLAASIGAAEPAVGDNQRIDESTGGPGVTGEEAPRHYPLAVGRYWVYRYHERDSDVVTQVERSITRRESRDGESDLFFFADGTIAYVDEGKIYEMGSNGGVNIIPVGLEVAADPVRYSSQGLQIEKWLATSDTAVVIDGHRFEQCLEVVTRFRPDDPSGGAAVSYSSFYAPGIGLVGRQQWPADSSGSLAVTLSEYGTRASPSIADGQL